MIENALLEILIAYVVLAFAPTPDFISNAPMDNPENLSSFCYKAKYSTDWQDRFWVGTSPNTVC